MHSGTIFEGMMGEHFKNKAHSLINLRNYFKRKVFKKVLKSKTCYNKYLTVKVTSLLSKR